MVYKVQKKNKFWFRKGGSHYFSFWSTFVFKYLYVRTHADTHTPRNQAIKRMRGREMECANIGTLPRPNSNWRGSGRERRKRKRKGDAWTKTWPARKSSTRCRQWSESLAPRGANEILIFLPLIILLSALHSFRLSIKFYLSLFWPHPMLRCCRWRRRAPGGRLPMLVGDLDDFSYSPLNAAMEIFVWPR